MQILTRISVILFLFFSVNCLANTHYAGDKSQAAIVEKAVNYYTIVQK